MVTPSLLNQAKLVLSKSKLGFLGKMSENDLEKALQDLYDRTVARYEA